MSSTQERMKNGQNAELFSRREFWTGISILMRNYHVVNKKIFGIIIGQVHRVTEGIKELSENVVDGGVKTQSCSCETKLEELESCLTLGAEASSAAIQGYVLHYKFLTKKAELKNIEALGIFDFTSTSYTCRISSDSFDDFIVRLRNGKVNANILTARLDVVTSRRWVDYVLLPKLLKWARNSSEDTKASPPQVRSLQLVDVEKYNDLYNELKRKYAKKVLMFWNEAKESTDPLKFIYEDLAIAAYLITMWQGDKSGSAPTVFADLGCGNGLLVYLLNEEGWRGYGYDIRARKLWTHYPNAAVRDLLIEQAVDPTSFNLPKDVGWLIGNHSDELSPWLPVLAATAGYSMRYFLLPCCAYEFSGAKFQRRNARLSAYQDFYAFARGISDMCGYVTLQDRLKIPSTKRLALVGMQRTHAQSEYASRLNEIERFVASERSAHPVCAGNSAADDGTAVRLRVKEEAVRNCTKIDKDILAALVAKVFNLLLHATDNLSPKNATSQATPAWRAGGQLTLREIARHFTPSDLRHIKAECGGIKTLLRNNHEIFEYRGDEAFGLRKPKQTTPKRAENLKRRQCYFQENHPNGCPLVEEQCAFIHTQNHSRIKTG